MARGGFELSENTRYVLFFPDTQIFSFTLIGNANYSWCVPGLRKHLGKDVYYAILPLN